MEALHGGLVPCVRELVVVLGLLDGRRHLLSLLSLCLSLLLYRLVDHV